jgi:hypothetical protein
VDDLLEPHNLERLRRSIAMRQPGRRDGLVRDKALNLIADLQRQDRRYRELVEQLRVLLAATD